jgi:hypothetical protein
VQPVSDGRSFPRLQLAHAMYGDSQGRDYDLYPSQVARPISGVVAATVKCGTCGEILDCRVASAQECHRRHVRTILRRCIMVAICVGVGVGLSITGPVLLLVLYTCSGDIFLLILILLTIFDDKYEGVEIDETRIATACARQVISTIHRHSTIAVQIS